MQCPRCQHENPAGQRFCGACGTLLQDPSGSTQPTPSYMDLQHSLTEALEQQTATAEILAIISRSPADAQPVFDAIAVNALRLCDAQGAVVVRCDGELLHLVAQHNVNPEAVDRLKRLYPVAPGRHNPMGRAVLDRVVVQVPDLQATEEFSGSVARQFGARGHVSIPLLHQDRAIGAIGISRPTLGPFSDRQIALLKTFANQAVIAIENVRRFNETKEALDRQTATSEILRVISQSPTDVQPVFDAIVENAARLCDGVFSTLISFDGELMRLEAAHNWTPEAFDHLARRILPAQPSRTLPAGRAILDCTVIHLPDIELDQEFGHQELTRAVGFRSILTVPMLRDGVPLGAISVARADPGAFSDNRIALLKTFADQAVIAIENVRLFTELQEKNQALTRAHAQVTEALDQQTATAEILRVISGSPTDLQPVMDTVAENAARLCEAIDSQIFRLEDGLQVRVASYGSVPTPMGRAAAPNRKLVSGRAIFERRTIHVHDLAAEVDSEYPDARPLQQATGQRTTLATPLLREGVAIGVILIRRLEVRPFSEKQARLLETFADQAVIAIENVRLFTELQASNRELTTALDTQTATSDILRVISRSQTDVQPVFEAIVANAVRLCRGNFGAVHQYDGTFLHLVAHHNIAGEALDYLRRLSPRPPDKAVRERRVTLIADFETEPEVPEATRIGARLRGSRSNVTVPMLRGDACLGVIVVGKREPGLFPDEQVQLLRTFADQAVIAIENVRLFKELEARTQDLTRSVGELRALGEVGQAISSTLDLQTVLSTIVARATQLSGTDAGVIYEYDEHREVFLPRATEHLEAEIVETMLATPVRKGEGATGRLAEVQEPIQVSDILEAPAESRVRSVLVRAGYRALLAVPLVREGQLLGGLTVIRKTTGAFAPDTTELLQTFATQSSLAIQNARLFREIEDKSRQLEVASQHKSEFLANMSHELRTPLNAIIGFSEVLTERMFGELNEKQEEYLKDIYASGTHLLSLINDILDLSKIEAGRMELELTDFDLPTALDNALTLVRERAGRRNIALQMSVDERLGEVRADERKIRQVVLNLLSNAIKFTPEGGRIEVAAVPKDGSVEVSVSDTGVGIAPEDQEAVFEEFRQVGSAEKKVEGTGLGLTLCRKFVELHGGRIWVKSQLGSGSTFTFTIPVRHGE
jgi:signal transduction histidine kinase